MVKLAGEVSPAFEEEKIHKIRTTIKKMRAIGDWADMPVKKFFRKSYKILGRIRDLQVVLSKIKKGDYIVPASFTEWLESNLHHFKAEWQTKYDNRKIKRQLANLKKSLNKAKKHNKKHALRFEKHKDESLSSFIHERPLSDEVIHSGRKTIKEIGFLNKWQNNSSVDEMNNLSDETGNYMDTITAIHLFEQYISEQSDESKKNEGEAILLKWKANKDHDKIHLLKSIDSLEANA